MNASFGKWASSGTLSTMAEDMAEKERERLRLLSMPVLAPGFTNLSTSSLIAPSFSPSVEPVVFFDNTSSRSGMAPMSEETRQEQQRYVEEKVQEALDNLPSDATPEEQEQTKQEAIGAALSSLIVPGPKNYLIWGLGGLLLIGAGFLIFRKKD
tara:strand:- start:1194 stop:1655 length:462 start_codon:yes stop_codon:yes gene_type:complete